MKGIIDSMAHTTINVSFVVSIRGFQLIAHVEPVIRYAAVVRGRICEQGGCIVRAGKKNRCSHFTTVSSHIPQLKVNKKPHET